jgi:hypothetical protein
MANSEFDDVYEDALDTLLDVMGSDATYTPLVGDAVSLRVFFDQETYVDPAGFTAATWTQRKTIEVKLDDLTDEPNAGDTFLIGSTTYTVTADEPENDGYTVKVVVK